MRTLHNYSDVVSGYVAPTAPNPSPNPNPNPNPTPNPTPNPSLDPNQVAPTVDHRSGALLLFFNVNYTQTWLRRSTDDGANA